MTTEQQNDEPRPRPGRQLLHQRIRKAIQILAAAADNPVFASATYAANDGMRLEMKRALTELRVTYSELLAQVSGRKD